MATTTRVKDQKNKFVGFCTTEFLVTHFKIILVSNFRDAVLIVQQSMCLPIKIKGTISGYQFKASSQL